MSTAVVALPASSDRNDWTPEESALVEASGLVHTDAQSGAKSLAERPVVAAFFQHCRRTGLDPIARQIYAIARKSRGQLKWQIQVSIDGARLIAERSGQYEGQTTPEFTGDGIAWTQVWLAADPPKAARVGVYRRGFREPLYAVALWDAYVQTKYNGDVTDMWSKMGPLMLAKCAEMLALRKAFPQDLSGLYSAEEMSQADVQPAPAASEELRTAGTGLSKVAAVLRGEEPVQADPAAVAAWLEWKEAIDAAPDRGALKDLVDKNGLSALLQREIPGDAKGRKVADYLNHAWSQLPETAPEAAAADPESGEVTEWKAAAIPADEPAEAVIDDDEIPF